MRPADVASSGARRFAPRRAPCLLLALTRTPTRGGTAMSERQKQHQGRSADDESAIPGRDFADTDIAAEPQEQRQSRRGRGNLDESGEATTAAIPEPNDPDTR